MRNVKPYRPMVAGLIACLPIQLLCADGPTPVLDGYAYQLTGNINIDLTNRLITIDSTMNSCQQANGDQPLDTATFALASNGQFIGLQRFRYNFNHQSIYFHSQTSDLTCQNGVYVDTLSKQGFEPIELIYMNGFE